MSKREIKLDVFQCDYKDESGGRCTFEGDRDTLKSCHVCHQDLCNDHCVITTVVFIRIGDQFTTGLLQGTRLRFIYYFCEHHLEVFRNTVTKRYGEGEIIPNIGDGTTLM